VSRGSMPPTTSPRCAPRPVGRTADDPGALRRRRAPGVGRATRSRGRRGDGRGVAAVVVRRRVTVVHCDRDLELVAQVTGQPTAWVVPAGTVTRARVRDGNRAPAARSLPCAGRSGRQGTDTATIAVEVLQEFMHVRAGRLRCCARRRCPQPLGRCTRLGRPRLRQRGRPARSSRTPRARPACSTAELDPVRSGEQWRPPATAAP